MSIKARQHYGDILEELKRFFPAPVSDPVMDGYFVHTISQFLDRVDRLKTAAPRLGIGQDEVQRTDTLTRFPEGTASVEWVTRRLVDYCRGMTLGD